MKINNTTNPDALKAYGTNSAERSHLTKESGQKQQGTIVSLQDKVDISSKVRMFQDIKKAALEAPDIRTGKVEEVQQKVANGIYRPDYSLVAEKLLSPDINDRI